MFGGSRVKTHLEQQVLLVFFKNIFFGLLKDYQLLPLDLERETTSTRNDHHQTPRHQGLEMYMRLKWWVFLLFFGFIEWLFTFRLCVWDPGRRQTATLHTRTNGVCLKSQVCNFFSLLLFFFTNELSFNYTTSTVTMTTMCWTSIRVQGTLVE